VATVAIYDYDYFNYENVIPNLECAKLVAYYRKRNDITLLAPALEPARYTKFIIRKEYNDGIFPREFFYPNCEYGGRAFNPTQYKPLDPKIEATIPDMHIYDRYISNFGKKPAELTQIKRILNCAHLRLAPDSQNLLSLEKLKRNFLTKPTGIILHDYNLAPLKPYDLIKELQDQRTFISKEGTNPYPVGNKYPIRIYSSNELQNWLKIVTIPGAFFLEYCGLMSDEILYNLCEENKRMARQVYYNITHDCTSENDFFINRLPKIFIQTLFLRKAGIKILLKYDEEILKTKELKLLIDLLNCWLSFQWQENFLPRRQNLYNFCKNKEKLQYRSWAFLTVKITVEQMRDIFQFIRENNYDLFKKFYEWDSVIYKEGEFINEWE
jgi:hypothetical protein